MEVSKLEISSAIRLSVFNKSSKLPLSKNANEQTSAENHTLLRVFVLLHIHSIDLQMIMGTFDHSLRFFWCTYHLPEKIAFFGYYCTYYRPPDSQNKRKSKFVVDVHLLRSLSFPKNKYL